MRYPLTLLLLLGIIASLAPTVIAAPSISGVSSPVASGESITVSGFDFGTHALQVESLQANIESGTAGEIISKSGWTRSDWADYDYGSTGPRYANDSAHSGAQSIKCSYNSGGNCAFAYDMQDVGPGQRFYATWWVKYSGSTAGQWKMFRASEALTMVDGNQQLNMFNWFSLQQQNVLHPGYPAQRTLWYDGLYPTGDNTWHRVELDYVGGSSGVANGVITVRVTKENGTIAAQTASDVNTHPNGGSWRYAIWQNYLGNGITGANNIWLDDLYVQYNTPARVELCAGSTWANRGKCEVQIPTSWKTDSISATVNTGNFQESSTTYLYVVDATGVANTTGYQVTIGGVPAQVGGGRLSGSLSGGGVMR
jgi:hypothetical protein